jgi:hypothetical protein
MNNYLSIANNILTGSLRPWSNENKDEEKFRHLLNHKLRKNKDNPSVFCKEVITAFNVSKLSIEIENIEELKSLSKVGVSIPLKIDLPKFFNKQTEFYSYLIKNTTQCILTGIIEIIENADEVDATYKLYQIFNKAEELISFSKNVAQIDKTSAWVIDLLELHLFIIHSTLSLKFTETINFEVLSNSEILFAFCPDFASEKSDKSKLAYYLETYISAQKEESIEYSIYTPQPITVKPQETHKNTFKPILDDNRPSKKGVLSFHDIIKNPLRFGSFEEKLFQNDYITNQYAYSGKQGYKNQMAIIYHLVIEKKYFKNFNDTDKKKISSRDIIKFLNHRYDLDVDKQFRFYKTKPIERANFIESTYWLHQLPMC